MRFTKRPFHMGGLAALAAIFTSCPVFAQTAAAPAAIASTPTPQENFEDGWRFSVGFGLFETPKYPGASANRVQPAPLVGISNGRYFFGSVPDANVPFGFGAYLYRDNHFRMGVALSYDMVNPRKASDDDHLRGLPDIDRTAHATLFGSYHLDWLSVVGAVSQDVAGKHEGATASLDLFGTYSPISKLTFTVGPGVTWGSARYNQTYYGVTAEDSARSGLPAHTPGSGVSALRITGGATYMVNEHWNVGARIGISRLAGEVSSSPIVEKKTQTTYGAFANYVF